MSTYSLNSSLRTVNEHVLWKNTRSDNLIQTHTHRRPSSFIPFWVLTGLQSATNPREISVHQTMSKANVYKWMCVEFSFFFVISVWGWRAGERKDVCAVGLSLVQSHSRLIPPSPPLLGKGRWHTHALGTWIEITVWTEKVRHKWPLMFHTSR